MAEDVACIVIGAGVVGLAVARTIARAGLEVIVLEAEDSFGSGISSRNSEVIHAGVYYPEGSLKARLCVQGREALYRYCARRDVAHARTGKLIVATDESEHAPLRKVQAHAQANGVDLEWLDGEQAGRLEPELSCTAALLSPMTGIIDSHALMLSLLGELEDAGGRLALKSPVTGGRVVTDVKGKRGVALTVDGDDPMEITAGLVVNSAGLSAQSVSRSIAGVPPETVPPLHYAKGSYFYLTGKAPFERLIYPLPQAASLGLHYTRDLGGQGRFGPDVEWVERPDYGVDPARAALFYESVRRYWPALPDGALQPGYAGIRPKLQAPGETARDFVIQGADVHHVRGYVALYGIESPGLTSCLAIADYVAKMGTETMP